MSSIRQGPLPLAEGGRRPGEGGAPARWLQGTALIRPSGTFSQREKALTNSLRRRFARATIDAETILLDEILAVGDAAFRRQCDERIERFVRNGATVVLVSHDLEALETVCRRTVWVAEGQIVADGATNDVVARYRAFVAERALKRQSAAPPSA